MRAEINSVYSILLELLVSISLNISFISFSSKNFFKAILNSSKDKVPSLLRSISIKIFFNSFISCSFNLFAKQVRINLLNSLIFL